MGLIMNGVENKEENKWIFSPKGDLDIYTSNEFKEIIINLFKEEHKDILIDGSNLEYVDSTGLGALIYLLKEVQNEGFQIYLENIKPNIKKLFSITELDKLFVIRGENVGE